MKNVIHQIDSKNKWLLIPASFTAKFGLVFVSTLKTLFLRGFILNPTERAKVLLKNSTKDFQNSPPFEKLACFYLEITENFKRFQYFNFETDFLEKENQFKKLEYRVFVECTKIENASFPYKTALSEVNVTTNRIVTTKWTYHKKWCFSSS